MIKEARKTSMDPAQERLRQTKAAWNKDVSALINDIIHLKKLMNGWPSKFFKERSKIGDPIPADPGTILGALAGDFQELSQRGNAIVQQQAQYSQTRVKKRKDQAVSTLDKLRQQQGPETIAPPAGVPTQPTGTDLSKQLAAWEQKYELVAEGSNPFSRFLTKIKTPRVGFGTAAQNRRLRMDMLKAALQSYRALGKAQIQITKSSKASIVDAHRLIQMAWNEWTVVSRNFNVLVNTMPGQQFRPEEMRDELPPGAEPDLPQSQVKAPPEPKPLPKPPAPISTPPPPYKDSLPPEEVAKKASTQLEVVAQAFLKKWLGKTRHQIFPGSSSGTRLQAFELANRARKNINLVMDLLEKGFDVKELGPRISEVSSQMNTVRSLMRSLYNTEKPPTKNTPQLDGGFF